MNKSFNAILIDDEESAINILSHLLGIHCPQINVVQKCHDLKTAVDLIKKCKPDVVFLDIEMPNYAGYEITSFFDKIDFEIIFVTAYDHYAIKAFEISAIDYLLKPIDIDRLKFAIKKFVEKEKTKDLSINYQVLKDSLKQDFVKKIVVQVNSGQKVVEVNEIIAIEANEAYSYIYTTDRSKFIYSKNLKYFEKLFDLNSSFVRTHKSWIVNTLYLKQYSKSKFSITLENNIEAKLSKYKIQHFEKVLMTY